MREVHPGLRAPADVIYFVGWITPRPNHRFAAFIRFTGGSGAYEELQLASEDKRRAAARALESYLLREDWRVLEAAVSMPGGVPASAPLSYKSLPVVLWPAEDTAKIMRGPQGRRPDGGPAA